MGGEAAGDRRVPVCPRRFDRLELLLVQKVLDSNRLPAAKSQAVLCWLLLVSVLLLNCLQA